MHRLGYTGTAPRAATRLGRLPELGRIDPEHVIGVHVNSLGASPPATRPRLAGLTEADQERLALLEKCGRDMSGYCHRPVNPAADARLRAHRFTGRPARLDRREVQGMDRPARRACPKTPSTAT